MNQSLLLNLVYLDSRRLRTGPRAEYLDPRGKKWWEAAKSTQELHNLLHLTKHE